MFLNSLCAKAPDADAISTAAENVIERVADRMA
jgi:hypothetical protein